MNSFSEKGKSYSANVKDEITKLRVRRADDAKALLCAFTLSIGALKLVSGEKNWQICCVSENYEAVSLAAKLASKYYGLEYTIKRIKHARLHAVYNELCLSGAGSEKFMLETGLTQRGSGGEILYSSAVPNKILKTVTQKKLFIRGLFLACGSVVAPEKAYYAELVIKNGELARFASELLAEFGINAKSAKRRANFIIYIKDAETLSDFMALTGASGAVMDISNIRIRKQALGRANREVNCITANIEKVSKTARKQAEDIRLIINTMGNNVLSPALYSVAEARLNNTDMSLTELSELLGIGKSAVNYRLRKLEKIAGEIRESGNFKTTDVNKITLDKETGDGDCRLPIRTERIPRSEWKLDGDTLRRRKR